MSDVGLVAYAVTREDDPRVVVATDDKVLSRAVALEIVAATPASRLGGAAASIRRDLLEERWADAVLAWMDATGVAIDAFPPTLTLWTERLLDEERTSLELRMAPIFDEPDGG